MNTDERLAVIETKLDSLTDILREHATVAETVSKRQIVIADRQDVRIRSLERFRNIAIGIVAVVASGSGAMWRYLS